VLAYRYPRRDDQFLKVGGLDHGINTTGKGGPFPVLAHLPGYQAHHAPAGTPSGARQHGGIYGRVSHREGLNGDHLRGRGRINGRGGALLAIGDYGQADRKNRGPERGLLSRQFKRSPRLMAVLLAGLIVLAAAGLAGVFWRK